MSNHDVEHFNHNGYIIRIQPDPEPESPRDWDNVGTMVCWHRRYSLGDEQPKLDPPEWRRQLALNHLHEIGFPDDLYPMVENGEEDGIPDERLDAVFDEHFVILPLFLFDHSGITMKTSSEQFHAQDSAGWDWGPVGYIYCTREKARQELSGDTEEELTNSAIKCLTGEVETYAQYLEGDIYGYIIESLAGDHIDSCWGFFGLKDCVEQAKEACPDEAKVDEEYIANV